MDQYDQQEVLARRVFQEWRGVISDSPGNVAMVEAGVRYVVVDENASALVFDAKALIFGLLTVGRNQPASSTLGNTASWFVAWLIERGYEKAIDTALSPSGMTPLEAIDTALQRDFKMVLSGTLRSQSQAIADAAAITVQRKAGDARHIFAVLLLHGVLADKLAEHLGVRLNAADQWNLAQTLIERIMVSPEQGELRGNWEKLMSPLRRPLEARIPLPPEDDPPPPPPPSPPASPPSSEPPPPELPFNEDDAEVETDRLNRGALAVVLARRLHAIWRRLNPDEGFKPAEGRTGFVMHLDAPWGGGKTTFANFVARVLDPYGYGSSAAFLTVRYGADANLSGLFAVEPPSRTEAPPGEKKPPAPPPPEPHHCRPWIVVEFNAWRMQHCNPPWWSFYQVVRKACFTAVRQRGDRPADLISKRPPPPQGLLERADNLMAWCYLVLRETIWRLSTPALTLPLLTFLGTAVILFSLKRFGIVATDGAKNSVGADVQSLLGWILAASAGLTVVGGAVSLFLRSLAPGLDPLAESLGLGRADPLERFRRHFHNTMTRIKRPVLVIVDDLDRCSPEAIVDLVRGMQTILRSPRVVFMILGDRDWIERAFESRHKDFAATARGADEQSIGARFVEKAVQMSFVLPGMEIEDQKAYVRDLLAAAQGGRPNTSKADEAGARLREKVRREAASQPQSAFDAGALRESARTDWAAARSYMEEAKSLLREAWSLSAAPGEAPSDQELEALAERQVIQIVNEEVAIQSAAAPEVEAETARRLLPLAPWLPSNPRQIKRILNGVAVYQAAALQHPTFKTAGDGWFQLAIWIVIMTEWPNTFRLLSACPELADVLASPDPQAALKGKGKPVAWPGSEAAMIKEIERILANPQLSALITGVNRHSEPRLDTAAVKALLVLTPPQSRLRLAETPPPKAAD